MEVPTTVMNRVETWLKGNYDAETKSKVKNLLENDQTELIDSFYQDLEFGTGGLRGIMGVGTNRMNIYTVGMATQGLCNYLKENFKNLSEIKIVVAHDSRNQSRLFAETVANICSANDIKVYLFDSLRPTPEMSFAIRHLGAQSGVNVTASHNPKEYNGYKAYWDDGAQLVSPHDKNVVKAALAITNVDDVKFSGKPENITIIGEEIDKIYLAEVKKLSLSPDAIAKNKDIKIVYTPLHGAGVKLVPAILKEFGFTNIHHVEAQDINDGNFPTVVSPNPENAEALTLSIKKAEEVGADLVLATDPDADRVGIAVRDNNGKMILLNGNQTGAVLTYYMLRKWKENGKLTGNEYVVKTIVTTELIKAIADSFKVESFDVLTGFKFIAEIIKKNEGKKTYIFGGEESYGYLAGEFVRDKDAVMACALIAECAAWAKENGMSLYQLLLQVYTEFGFYKEALLNITKKGKTGAEEIQKMMADYRKNPPTKINGVDVICIKDYETSTENNLLTKTIKVIDQPKSNVLQFLLKDETIISVRPSGTEPKIKFYFGVKEDVKALGSIEKALAKADDKIKSIIESLGVN
jgi:phosphoglucomutase